MTKKIKVYNIGDNTKEEKFLKEHPYFTKNFRMFMCAPTSMGKSQLLYNFLFNEEFLLKMVRKSTVNCFIPTETTCEEMQKLAKKSRMKKEKFHIMNYWMPERCEEIYNSLEKKTPNFLIFDDVAFLKNFGEKHKKTIIDTLLCAGRHKNIYTIILGQKYTHLNENIRCNNCNIIVFFYGLNSKELERIYIEHLSFLDRDQFDKLIKENLNEVYKFILFNKKSNKIFNKDFDEIKFLENE